MIADCLSIYKKLATEARSTQRYRHLKSFSPCPLRLCGEQVFIAGMARSCRIKVPESMRQLGTQAVEAAGKGCQRR